jgi:hypothetical protein
MTKQVDYQVLLETAVTAAVKAAESAKQEGNSDLLFAYYDILDVIKTQANIMEVPLGELGLENVDLDELLKATVDIEKHKQAA